MSHVYMTFFQFFFQNLGPHITNLLNPEKCSSLSELVCFLQDSKVAYILQKMKKYLSFPLECPRIKLMIIFSPMRQNQLIKKKKRNRKLRGITSYFLG